MLAELIIAALPLSLMSISSMNTIMDQDNCVTRDSPFSYVVRNDNENVSVAYGQELFYFDNGEYKEYPTAFNENDSSYFISIPNNDIRIMKSNLNQIKVNDRIIVFNHNSISIDNYTLFGASLKRIDTISCLSELNGFGIFSTYNNLTIEIYDSRDDLLFIGDYDSFVGYNYLSDFSLSCSYPLTVISNVRYEVDRLLPTFPSPFLREKYFEVGQNHCVENASLLKVGVSELMFYGPNGNYYPEYKTVFEITLPTFSSAVDHYVNISLKLKRNSGFLNDIEVYKVDDESFDNIDGISSFSSSYLGTMSLSNDFFSIDIRLITDCISSLDDGDKFVLILESCYSYSSSANIYSSTSSYPPSLSREHHSIFGNAGNYNFVSNGNLNCYGYALGLSSGVQIIQGVSNTYFPQATIQQKIIDGVVNDISSNHNCIARYLASIDEYITANERRIVAFIYYTGNYVPNHFHFMKECSDGCWADKNGIQDSQCHLYGETPEDIISTYLDPFLSDWPPLYFAISPITGGLPL